MDDLGVAPGGFWRSRRVFVTGHTGFKGGWLSAWLVWLGAHVFGYALRPETRPSFFEVCALEDRLRSVLGDIRDLSHLDEALRSQEPEVVFHLAAQPIVRRSYRDPVETFSSNIMGTVNVLEAVRRTPSVRAVVIVTSDKCYDNRDWPWGYRETDQLGGRDPYSASKACAELVTAAYRSSFLTGEARRVGIATARAGNVLGGGDWAEDRLVPDAIRAFQNSEPLRVRNPASYRPWQHVLEPLMGYLMLAERLHDAPAEASGAWNFGPDDQDPVTVAELSEMLVKAWGAARWQAQPEANAVREMRALRLDCSKSRSELGWRPRLSLSDAVQLAVDWYRRALSGSSAERMFDTSIEQIESYADHRKLATSLPRV